MELGERIATLREEQALTQIELAEAARISPSTLSQIESGRVPRPHVGTVRKIARALGIEPAELRRTEELAFPKADEAPDGGPSLLNKALDAARQDEKKGAQAVNRLVASEGTLSHTNMTCFEEDKFRAELRARGFPDEYFEGFIWPLVTTVNQQEWEISRLREENARLREEAEQESVHR
jgi:transcriptional regulator with XRE-family HTH domain